jgi:hypothetical protein
MRPQADDFRSTFSRLPRVRSWFLVRAESGALVQPRSRPAYYGLSADGEQPASLSRSGPGLLSREDRDSVPMTAGHLPSQHILWVKKAPEREEVNVYDRVE